jgi:hypothetical protein
LCPATRTFMPLLATEATSGQGRLCRLLSHGCWLTRLCRGPPPARPAGNEMRARSFAPPRMDYAGLVVDHTFAIVQLPSDCTVMTSVPSGMRGVTLMGTRDDHIVWGRLYMERSNRSARTSTRRCSAWHGLAGTLARRTDSARRDNRLGRLAVRAVLGPAELSGCVRSGCQQPLSLRYDQEGDPPQVPHGSCPAPALVPRKNNGLGQWGIWRALWTYQSLPRLT